MASTPELDTYNHQLGVYTRELREQTQNLNPALLQNAQDCLTWLDQTAQWLASCESPNMKTRRETIEKVTVLLNVCNRAIRAATRDGHEQNQRNLAAVQRPGQHGKAQKSLVPDWLKPQPKLSLREQAVLQRKTFAQAELVKAVGQIGATETVQPES
jgi:hypothetical protein